MPNYSTLIHGTLPVEVELTPDGTFMEMSTWSRKGIIWLDLTDEEYERLVPDHQRLENECMEEYVRAKTEWDRRMSHE